MTLVGCGAATLGVLRGVASFSIPFLYCVFAIPTITVNIGSCITSPGLLGASLTPRSSLRTT